ncbi:MAG: SDR family NAD(P)-dependent oxidoreductase [Burkholderiaceae bacterium]|nr:SDR family NAD(P)-dependent oxidoreductase [Burkholderiaceae bacterium]
MKTAVITGASSGIGEACARLLARNGWNVFLVARRRDRLENIACEINGHAIVMDVTKAQEGNLRLVTHCDLLVNCAGGALGMNAVGEASADDWTNMFNTNVLGTLRMIQLLLPRLIESQGCVMNITSTAALGGYERGGGYCAAKSAQRALTQSLRLEMKGIPVRITEVLPGMVCTPEFSLNRFRGDFEKAKAVYENVDRPLTADDVAQVVVGVASLPAHVNVDEIVVRPVAQRAQHALFRGDLRWREEQPSLHLPIVKGAR